jgi:hypothetical protein
MTVQGPSTGMVLELAAETAALRLRGSKQPCR